LTTLIANQISSSAATVRAAPPSRRQAGGPASAGRRNIRVDLNQPRLAVGLGAIRIEPDPAKRSSTMSLVFLECLIARSTSAGGFQVG
jgi:hypothetical protein